jgi:tetratricopeptide (TPR) repeat protein
MKRQYIYPFILFSAFLIVPILTQDTRDFSLNAETAKNQTDAYSDQLGAVQFPMSCSDEAKPQVERGVALLHHMTYHGARSAFVAAARTDPECAMSYWGQAMTYIHPLWSDAPSKEDFETGQSLIDKAAAHGKKTDREDAYIEAVAAYYEMGWNKKETKNLQSFEAGWKKVYQKFPMDVEAASFYALAHMATASPGDKTYKKQKQAGSIVEKVLTQVPDHPGAHHYLIHAYDYPPTAPKALNVARSYGEIAPDIPHALHMPTHIFTRVGLWQESIIMNKRSAAAALRHPAGSEISLHYPHALDYLAYAYLQQADDRRARQVMAEILDKSGSYQSHIAASYAFTAIPARFALERQQWEDAAALKPSLPKNYSMDNFPAMEAVTYFARALGAARSGNLTKANQAFEKLTAFQKRAEKNSAYWAKQIEIQRLSAMAWIMYQEGKKNEALMVMRQSAELESSTEKHPVTPGEILPARELLGDMLLDMGRYGEARSEYETALKRSPNRLNSLFGAGLAAELGHDEHAELYYRKIVEMTDTVATDREQVKHARRYIAKEA